MKLKQAIIFIFLLFFIGCYSFEIHSPNGNNIIEDKTSCEEVRTFKQWKILYGLINLSSPEPEEIFEGLDPGRAYYIEETVRNIDIPISLVLGLFTSMSTNTIVVHECGESNQICTKKTNKNNSRKGKKQLLKWVEKNYIINGRKCKRLIPVWVNK